MALRLMGFIIVAAEQLQTKSNSVLYQYSVNTFTVVARWQGLSSMTYVKAHNALLQQRQVAKFNLKN